MAKTKKDQAEKANNEAAITANLVLVSYAKQKGTDVQPGYKIRLIGPLPSIGRDNESEAKKPKHGLLKITNRTMFDGVRSVTMTGKLNRKFKGPGKNTQGYQTWDFRLANVPTLEHANILHELARANGDDVQAEVEVVFTEQDEEKSKAPKVDEGKSLDFGDEEDEIERIKNMDAEGFDQGPDANVRPGSDAAEAQTERKRRRKVAV